MSVPANPRARRIAKSFCADNDVDRLFGVPAENGRQSVIRALPGKYAETNGKENKGVGHMTTQQSTVPLGKRIELAELKVVQLKDELTKVDGEISQAETPTDEQAQHVEVLRGEIETTEKTVATLKSIEQGLKLKAVQASAIKLPATAAKKIDPRDYIYRAATVHFIAKMQQRPIEAVLAERYPGDDGTNAGAEGGHHTGHHHGRVGHADQSVGGGSCRAVDGGFSQPTRHCVDLPEAGGQGFQVHVRAQRRHQGAVALIDAENQRLIRR